MQTPLPRTDQNFQTDDPSWKRLLLIIGLPAGLLILLAGYGLLRYVRMNQELTKIQEEASVSGTLSDDTQQKIIEEVASLVVVPDEEPTIAFVSNVDQLTGQAFFSNAQNGDVVLVYEAAKKAILYRPSTKQVVEVAPIDLGGTSAGEVAGSNDTKPQPTTGPTGTPTPTPTPQSYTLTVRNGTTIPLLAKRYGDSVVESFPNIEFINSQNANVQNYSRTILVNLTDKDGVDAVAETLGIAVQALPSGEPSASTDLLIIVGEDKSDI